MILHNDFDGVPASSVAMMTNARVTFTLRGWDATDGRTGPQLRSTRSPPPAGDGDGDGDGDGSR